MVCVSVPVAAAEVGSDVAAGASTFEAASAADAVASFGTYSAAQIAGASTVGSIAGTLGNIGTIVSLVGTGVSGLGAYQQGKAGAESAKYNAAVAGVNANIATQNETRAAQAGEQQVAEQQQKTREEVGQITANEAASGLEVGTGSAADVITSATQVGQLNALTIRSNATQQAYGYENQAASYKAEQGLNTSTASNDITAGEIGAGSTLLSGAGNAALNYGKFLANNSTFLP